MYTPNITHQTRNHFKHIAYKKKHTFTLNPYSTMPSVSETGHAKNVANFEELITFCEGYGATYNPSKDTLQIDSLKKLLAEARKELDNVISKVTALNNAITTRQNTFADIKPLCTKVINAFSVTNAAEQTVAEAKAFNKKIQGTRAKKKTIASTTEDTNTTPDAKTISTSQQSYDSLTEHIAKLISLLNAEPSYKPNEVPLQTASLTTLLEAMKSSTKSTNTAFTEVSNARITRNEVLYKENTGIHSVATDVKKYIKSIFGSTSPQYKQVSAIRFSSLK